MAGLPFNPLPAAQAGDVRLGRMLGNLRTGQVEPVYSEADYQRGPDPSGRPVVELAPMPTRTDQVQADPMAFHSAQLQAQLDQLREAADTKRADLEKSITPQLRAADEQYQIDLAQLTRGDLGGEDKAALRRKLDAQHAKKVISIRSKITGDLDLIDKANRDLAQQTAFQAAQTEGALKQVVAIGQEAGWSPYEIKRQQMKVLGVTLPAEETPKVQTLKDAYVESNRLMRDYQRELANYVITPPTKNWLGKTIKGSSRLKILKPEYRNQGITPADYDEAVFQDPTPEERALYESAKQRLSATAEQVMVYRDQLDNRHIPSIAAIGAKAMSPLAQSIPRPTPAVQASSSSAEDRILVRNPQGQVGRIPRSQLAEALANGYVQVR